jgi:hypothetical protein
MTRYPEVEGQLKLLYTGVTRCINRLFFAETSNSVSGAAFARWLATPGLHGQSEALGVRSSVDNVEKMTLTPDEWCSRGLENAMMAETTEDLVNAESLLERALYCFQQIGDVALCSKARANIASIRFRASLEDGSTAVTTDAVDELEVTAARIMEGLLAEGLLVEARTLCTSIASRLPAYSQEQLQQRFVSKLNSF